MARLVDSKRVLGSGLGASKPPGVACPAKGPATIGRKLLSKEKQGLNPDSAPEKTCEEPCLDTHIRV